MLRNLYKKYHDSRSMEWIKLQTEWEYFQETPSKEIYDKIMNREIPHYDIRENNLRAIAFFKQHLLEDSVREFLKEKEKSIYESKRAKRLLGSIELKL